MKRRRVAVRHLLKTLPPQVKGFLPEIEGMRLYELAREAGRLGPCLEIGSYCGKSTIYLGLGCKEAGTVLYSIDHHRGSEEHQPGQEYHDPDLFDPRTGLMDSFGEFRKTLALASLEDTVVPIVAPSFVDYTCWATHVMPGGYLAVHDIFPDPTKGGQAPYTIYKLAVASGLFEELPMVETLGVLRRRCGQKATGGSGT